MKNEILKLLAKYTELDIDNNRSILSDDHFDKVTDEIISHFKNFGGANLESETGYRLLSNGEGLKD